VITILHKADGKLKNLVNSDIDRFVRILKREAVNKGVKWEDLVLRFEWSYEQDEIVKFMNENDFLT